MSIKQSNNKHKTELGRSGGNHCVHYLREQGYTILSQNFHSPYGEIDIIASRGSSLAFIEVKTRTKAGVDHTLFDITRSKQKKITQTAMCFLADYHNPETIENRFDVMILKKLGDTYDVHHIINAFPPAEVGDFFP